MTHLTDRLEGTTDNQSYLDAGPGAELMPVPGQKQQGGFKIRLLDKQSGKIGWAILWLLGIPLPVLVVVYLIWSR